MRTPYFSLGFVFRARGGWWVEAGLVLLFVLFTWAVASGLTHGLDQAVWDFCKAHRTTVLYWIARGLNLLGQGGILTWVAGLGLSALVWWRIRRWQAFLPWALAFGLTYLTLGPLKIWSMRASPNYQGPNAVEFFNEAARNDGYAMGYPSGHVVNAIVWWGVIALLLRRKHWAIQVLPPAVVLCTTTYLGFHWLTDGIGAILLGLFLNRLIHRFRWDEILSR
jgi:membrane-associated phospholipid phosphatase